MLASDELLLGFKSSTMRRAFIIREADPEEKVISISMGKNNKTHSITIVIYGRILPVEVSSDVG